MKDRRQFIKTIAVGTSGLALGGTAAAQTIGQVPGLVTYLLDEPQIVTNAAVSASVLVTTFNVTSGAASTGTLSIGIPTAGPIS